MDKIPTRFCLVLSLMLSLLSCERKSLTDPIQQSKEQVCPYQSTEEWEAFLRVTAAFEKWEPTCEDSVCDKEFYNYVNDKVQGVFEKCGPFLGKHPSIAQCTNRLKRFTPAWLKQHDDVSYGFIPSNHEYLQAQEGKELPTGMMNAPAAIVAAIPDREKVIEAARKNGFKYLVQESGLDGTRTFVFIPDVEERFDQWLLLNLQEGKMAIKLNTPLSILVVQKKDKWGRKLSRIRLHFRDYTIVPAATGFKLHLHEENNGKCYSCHTNGVRQLIPRVTPALQASPVKGESGYEQAPRSSDQGFAYQRLKEFNRKLRSYGNPDWTGQIIPDDYGPPLGKNQGCMNCHDGVSRTTLNMATSITQLQKKVYYQLSMPPDTHLMRLLERNEVKNPELSGKEAEILERALHAHAKLIKDFSSSRLSTLREWLLEISCR